MTQTNGVCAHVTGINTQCAAADGRRGAVVIIVTYTVNSAVASVTLTVVVTTTSGTTVAQLTAAIATVIAANPTAYGSVIRHQLLLQSRWPLPHRHLHRRHLHRHRHLAIRAAATCQPTSTPQETEVVIRTLAPVVHWPPKPIVGLVPSNNTKIAVAIRRREDIVVLKAAMIAARPMVELSLE